MFYSFPYQTAREPESYKTAMFIDTNTLSNVRGIPTTSEQAALQWQIPAVSLVPGI